ncbi:MAG: UDP-N-acetylglucosamine 1-carboxyvinyltransferase [Papillibacter sp.]|jgi:UDP-N-acetylglucosamine 1-carboxyvinyltransferase|nr:UDP-N-acetylglucosamine 1-carboxyvinyltransferase [Papillibacter sp.]
MSVLQIIGGKPLNGIIRVQGAKNSALPIIAATVLAEGVSVIENCPKLSDTDVTIRILRYIGCEVWQDGDNLYIDSSKPIRPEIPDSLMGEMRSSVVFLGAILARAGEAHLSTPGGCELGPRPIDLHISALRSLGTEIDDSGGRLACKAARLTGARIDLSIPSVGATENAMLAATRAEGTTIITNAAKEPEIEDLQAFLQKTGALITGAGTSIIRIKGVKEAHGARHRVIPDRIAACTWLAACASAGGEVKLYDTEPRHYLTVIQSLHEMGCTLDSGEGMISIKRTEPLKAAKPIITKPYPAFPTDAQPPLMAAALKAEGTTVFVENMFENRYRHAEELKRMGADIKTEGKTAIVCGVRKTYGTSMKAADLRGGAALAIAALGAEGVSEIRGLNHIDRGYESIEQSLAELGADIQRI